MKKKLLFTLLLIWNFGIYSAFSQNSEFTVVGPNEVLNYNQAVYTVTRYKEPLIDFGASIFNDTFEAGWILDRKEEALGGNIFKTTYTLLFYHEGTYKIFKRHPVTVKPNPLKIEFPSHICPYGTQLVINKISPAIKRTFTVTGNSTVKISNTGFMTYAPNSSGQISIKYEQAFNGSTCYHWIDKEINLNPHDLRISYNQSDENGSIVTQGDFQCGNTIQIKPNMETSIYFNRQLDNFRWKTLTPGTTKASYDKFINVFRFTPAYGGTDIRIDFEYHIKDCPVAQKCSAIFDVQYNYKVSYMTNNIYMEREGDISITKRSSFEYYKIVDVSTGSIKKEGILTPERMNQIDVASLSEGVYIVYVFNSNTTNSYKISINR